MTVWVYICPQGEQQERVEALPAGESGSCTTGNGQWVEMAQWGFMDYTIDEQGFADLLMASLMVLVLAYSIRQIIRVFRR